MANWPWHFAAAMIRKSMSDARREIPTAKNLPPIFLPCHRSDGWKLNLREIFRASRESEIETTRKNFLDSSHMKL